MQSTGNHIYKAMMVRRSHILLVFWLLLHLSSYAEIKKIGTPYIRNFLKREYKAGTQNWNIVQDKRGFIYTANNEGLPVSYTHLRAHETDSYLVCRLLLEK